MLFERKKKINDEIKEALEADAPEMPSIPAASKSIKEELPVPTDFEPQVIRESSHDISAPLFVKVDKYREILTSVQEMKIFVSATKQIFNVLHDVESVRNDTLKILRATLQRLEKTTTEIDVELLRPKGVDMSDVTHGEPEVHSIETSLNDLQKQLADLRKELKDVN